MRNPKVCHLVALLALAVFACGPSSKETAASKSARYKGDKLAIFNAARSAVEAKYKLAKSDENTLELITEGRWFTPDGQHASERMDDIRDVPDKSLNIGFTVQLLPDGDAWVVKISPKIMKLHAGSPQPEPLAEDDIAVPGWAHGKVDAMANDIHDALKQYELQSLPAGPGGTGGPAPGATPPAPAPAAPAPTPAG